MRLKVVAVDCNLLLQVTGAGKSMEVNAGANIAPTARFRAMV